MNAEYWNDQVAAFRRAYRVVRYDRRGFGKSGGVPDVTADAADLGALLRHLGIDSSYILGHSQGGHATLAFALNSPRSVRALVLLGSLPPQGFGLPWTGPDSNSGFDRVARTEGLDAMWKFLDDQPVLKGDRLSPEASDRFARIRKTYTGADLFTKVTPYGEADPPTMARLQEIRVPALVVTGDAEIPYLRVVADALAYAIPGAQRLVIPGGGHLVNLSQPVAYNAAVMSFLAAVDGRQKQ
jgi:pimeloyl-ACP methyl ester carboxylesterase